MAAVTITLGGIALDPDIDWQERRQSQDVAQSAQPTLGGGVVILASRIEAGKPITLVSGQDFGTLTTAQVGAIRAMANELGGVYSLEIESGSNLEEYTVMFRHNDPPAFDAKPLIPRIVPNVGDYFHATIKLITV